MIKQARVVDAFKHNGVSISFLDNDSFIANTDCCTIDLDNIEEKVVLAEILADYEKEMTIRIDNCKGLRQFTESEIADYIFTELPAVKIDLLTKIRYSTGDFQNHCDNCDEPAERAHFAHPEDDKPVYICGRCLAGETHE